MLEVLVEPASAATVGEPFAEGASAETLERCSVDLSSSTSFSSLAIVASLEPEELAMAIRRTQCCVLCSLSEVDFFQGCSSTASTETTQLVRFFPDLLLVREAVRPARL